MPGFHSNKWIVLALVGLFAGCTSEESPPDAGQPADTGVLAPDAGLPPDAGPPADSGPEVRALIEAPLFPVGQADNYMLAPDFDLGMFNLGWSAAGAQGGAAKLVKIYDPRLPGPRPDAARIGARDSAPGGPYLIGFGHAPPAPLRLEVWAAQTLTATAPGDGVQLGLYGISMSGEEQALLLEPEAGAEVELDDQRWRRWVGETPERWLGFVTFLVINQGATELTVGPPTLGPAPQGAAVGGVERVRPGHLRTPSPAERRRIGKAWREQRRGPPPERTEEVLRRP